MVSARRAYLTVVSAGDAPNWTDRELVQTLLARDLPPALAVELRDFLLLERSGARYTDLGAWIYDIDVLAAGRGRVGRP